MVWRHSKRIFWSTLLGAAYRSRRLGFAPTDFHLIVRRATVYDGSGREPYVADIGVQDDRIVAIGDLASCSARRCLDADGLALAPGFINTLSWASESLLADPTAASDVLQGVTLEVFGEGVSMGPLTADMRRDLERRLQPQQIDVDWNTLGEYLERLERRGVVPNVASLVGATTVRINVLGHGHRVATDTEVAAMCELVRDAMREGALGVGSALIYSPASSAGPSELLALARAAAEFGGAYYSHVRSETAGLAAAVDEVIEIARVTGQHAEIYHLKAAGSDNWQRLEAVIARIEAAQQSGIKIGANMYPYTSAATGLDAAMPPWVQDGGADAWFARLADRANRPRLLAEIAAAGDGWENLYHAAGGASRVTLLGLISPRLQRYNGQTLEHVARQRDASPEATIIDLVLEDRSRVTSAFELMSAANVERQLQLPWVSLCSDAETLSQRDQRGNYRTHPRACGSFARFLGHYVRERRVVTLAAAIRRLTSLPAERFKLHDRGRIALGCYADLVLFDPQAIQDHATLEQPRRFATGVVSVIVNGQLVLHDGSFTGVRPGRFVRGPGHDRLAPRGIAAMLPRAAG